MKFYLDEHIPKAVAEGLRRRGIDVLTVQEARRVGDPDRKLLAFAAMKRRVVVTGMGVISPIGNSLGDRKMARCNALSGEGRK